MNNVYDSAFIKICEKIFEHPTLVYVAVGSAAHILTNDEGILKIQPEHDQQYPKFLQDFKDKYINVPIVIVLIDKMLRTDPFIVKSRYIKNTTASNVDVIQFNDNSAPLDMGWELEVEVDTMKIYENINMKITVCAIKDNVDYGYFNYHNSDNVDITKFNDSLATVSIENNGCFIFNDYTGRDFSKYVDYMNKKYNKYLDRAIFGLGFDDYYTCYPELLKDHCMVQLSYTENKINVFNPHRYMLNVHLYGEKLPNGFCVNIIKEQLKRCIRYRIFELDSNMFVLYRFIMSNTKEDLQENQYIQKCYESAKNMYGEFEFNKSGIMSKITIELTDILLYVNSCDKYSILIELLRNDNIYTGIQNFNTMLMSILSDFVEKLWV
jgi:hypothetical protein